MNAITGLLKTAQKFTVDNAPAILAGTAVAGTVGTAIAVGKGSFQASDDIRQEELRMGDPILGAYELSTKEKVQLVWKRYIPAAAIASTTIVCIISGATVAGRRNAALIAAYSVSETMFSEYKDKVIEQIGENKEQKVRDSIAQDHVTNNPPNREVIFAGSKEVLCYEGITGRYFHNTAENIRRAQNEINLIIINNMYVSLNEYFSFIGLEPTGMGEELGWNNATPLDIQFSSVLDPDQVPTLHLGYRHLPVPNFTDNH